MTQNESDIQQTVLSLLKKYDDKIYESITNQQFTEFLIKVSFNNNLSAVKSDFIEGYLKEVFKSYSVKDQLDSSAVSTSGEYLITLSHIAEEFKRYNKDFRCETC